MCFTLLCATNTVLFGQLLPGQIVAPAFLLRCSLAVHLALLESLGTAEKRRGATGSSKSKQALLLPCSGTQGNLLGSSEEYPFLLVLYCAASACLVCDFGHCSCLHVLLSLEYL